MHDGSQQEDVRVLIGYDPERLVMTLKSWQDVECGSENSESVLGEVNERQERQRN